VQRWEGSTVDSLLDGLIFPGPVPPFRSYLPLYLLLPMEIKCPWGCWKNIFLIEMYLFIEEISWWEEKVFTHKINSTPGRIVDTGIIIITSPLFLGKHKCWACMGEGNRTCTFRIIGLHVLWNQGSFLMLIEESTQLYLDFSMIIQIANKSLPNVIMSPR